MTQIGKSDTTPCPPASRPWVLAAAIVGSSMAFLDGTVVNVALPALQRDLHATAFQAQRVVESYALLLLAALLLVGGALGDHFGRRRIFAIGVGLFACGGRSLCQRLSLGHADVRRTGVAERGECVVDDRWQGGACRSRHSRSKGSRCLIHLKHCL